MIVRHLLQPEVIVSRRAFLGGLACFGGVLALGRCADLGRNSSALRCVGAIRRPDVARRNHAQACERRARESVLGLERASTMIVARAKQCRRAIAACRSPRSDWPIGVLMGSNRCPEKSATFSRRPAAEATS